MALDCLPKVKTVRWILGDQLNARHSWFQEKSEDTLYVIAELPQEVNYVRHHVQKVCAFFLAMQAFAQALQQSGHRVLHLTLDDSAEFESLSGLIQHVITQTGCASFEYQRPDEYRLLSQLDELNTKVSVTIIKVDSEHFLVPFEELQQYFKPNTAVRMEMFYRKMRKRFNILMTDDGPLGERWNFDAENRKALSKNALPDIPQPLMFSNNAREVLARLARHKVNTIGEPNDSLLWPVNRTQSLALLNYFCEFGLSNFGLYQDAMTEKSEYQWSLYHSRLSFSLNTKMLHPMQVIQTAIQYFETSEGEINLAQVEGFIRQILGWREYVRGMYWSNMPQYRRLNALDATTPLPGWYWSSNTKMNCIKQSIQQTMTYSYAHHIQRLMVTGNFALLAGLAPDDVDAWYLGVYIDAVEWVELPNTRGMALFADGGLIASKPYAASGNYINKMSDYCKGCAYNVKEKLTDDACPFNALYWHFINRHEDRFGRNPRMAFPYNAWRKYSPEEQADIVAKGERLLADMESL
ncbi:cryptochrome/photolyase family protein [Neptunomonas antarctica]|uniref:Deoxyribodipyrimidine photolyase-related protein n=1 Tax=Neptunomonas antarctica TaxID=619304 RepID=A0A1N7L6V9_9GAMM|nr:cryptochrome/photolyase family protein [Neptunomonas antarctica]SIS69547.1 deoxyribodipyrimidine photolyase-related protein [Neptunomonas antarctica]